MKKNIVIAILSIIIVLLIGNILYTNFVTIPAMAKTCDYKLLEECQKNNDK